MWFIFIRNDLLRIMDHLHVCFMSLRRPSEAFELWKEILSWFNVLRCAVGSLWRLSKLFWEKSEQMHPPSSHSPTQIKTDTRSTKQVDVDNVLLFRHLYFNCFVKFNGRTANLCLAQVMSIKMHPEKPNQVTTRITNTSLPLVVKKYPPQLLACLAKMC